MSRGRDTIKSAILKLPKGSKLLLGVSGGIDSVVLLHACVSAAKIRQLHLEVAHIDHGLRESSAGDANFVQALSKSYNLPFHKLQAGTKPKKENTEAWGRKVRYTFFEKVRKKRKLDFIVTAHTGSDSVETLLMRLLSNKEPRNILPTDERRQLLRPLLNIFREEILQYENREKLTHREDPTNLDEAFLRNKVRHTILPALRLAMGKGVDRALNERAMQIASDIASIDSFLETRISKISAHQWGSKVWLKEVKLGLKNLPEGARWRLVEAIMLSKLGYKVGMRRSQEIISFLEGNSPRLELPNGYQLLRKSSQIVLRKK